MTLAFDHLAAVRPRPHALAVAVSRSLLCLHGKSFALASCFLPAGVRDEAAIVYAFCRRADDAVDLAAPTEQPRRAATLRRELDAIFAGKAQSDVVLGAFQRLVLERGIPQDYPGELVAGIEMDAQGTEYADVDALLGYCFRVAGTVGLMMSHVLGVRDRSALQNAAHLGIAMQLTNICRDVGEDWSRGRLYLPSALTDGALASPRGERRTLEAARVSVARATRALLGLAERFYESGELGIPALPFRAALTVRTARLVYSEIGRAVLRNGADPLAPRAVVGTARKLVLSLRAVFETLPMAGRGFVPARLTTQLGCSDVVRL